MLYLIPSLEAHRDSLMKVLSAPHFPTVDQFDDVVTSITTRNFLGFSDYEFPSEGKNHNKDLHISLRCVDTLLSRVIMDMRSLLNFIPKTTLLKLSLEGVAMKTSALKAFDGSRRVVIGEVDLPIRIGPTTFAITFQVMDIRHWYPKNITLEKRKPIPQKIQSPFAFPHAFRASFHT